ncbi:MAG: hypothetical protein M1837_003547, partial [Sclerophora amabilis]
LPDAARPKSSLLAPPLAGQPCAPRHTFLPQHVPTAHTVPLSQSALVVQSGSGAQFVPGPQKPAPDEVAKQPQLKPPHSLRLSQNDPSQDGLEHKPFWQIPEEH